MNFTEKYESYIKNVDIFQKVKYLDDIIEKLKRIDGYGECPYCCHELNRVEIQNELKQFQDLRQSIQSEYELETKKRVERDRKEAEIRSNWKKTFEKYCNELKPILMPRIRKIVTSLLADWNHYQIVLPSNLSENEKKAWDWLMERYMDDDGERDEFLTNSQLYYYQYKT